MLGCSWLLFPQRPADESRGRCVGREAVPVGEHGGSIVGERRGTDERGLVGLADLPRTHLYGNWLRDQ